MRISYPIALCLLGSASFAQDIELDRTHSRWRLSWETLDADALGDAQWIGVHYDILGILDAYKPFFAGLGGYTQFAGDADGSFAMGVTSGVRYSISDSWRVEGGLFLGGGTIGGNEEEKGWVSRPFVALERLFDNYGLRVELAYIDFDQVEGDLALSLGVTLPSEWLRGSPSQLPDRIPRSALKPRETRVTPRFGIYAPSSKSKTRNGDRLRGDFEMIGLELDYFLSPKWFVPLEAYSASGGDVDGFGIGLVGIGYRHILGDGFLSIETKASGGIASGGRVDTGGGLAFNFEASLRANLTRNLSAELGSAYLTAPNGDFEATALTVGLSWTAFPIELNHRFPRGKLWDAGLSKEDAELGSTSAGLISKFYSPKGDSKKKDGSDLDGTFSLIGIEVAEPLSKYLAATGRAFVAWDGESGGYREGMFGLRATHSTYERPEYVFSVGLEAGAGGGGQVDVGSGLLVNVSVGVKYTLSENSFASFEYGRTKSSSGSFEAESVSVGIGWNLQRPMSR